MRFLAISSRCCESETSAILTITATYFVCLCSRLKYQVSRDRNLLNKNVEKHLERTIGVAPLNSRAAEGKSNETIYSDVNRSDALKTGARSLREVYAARKEATHTSSELATWKRALRKGARASSGFYERRYTVLP